MTFHSMLLTIILRRSKKRQHNQCQILHDIQHTSEISQIGILRIGMSLVMLQIHHGHVKPRHGLKQNRQLPYLPLRREVPDSGGYRRQDIEDVTVGVRGAREIEKDGIDDAEEEGEEGRTYDRPGEGAEGDAQERRRLVVVVEEGVARFARHNKQGVGCFWEGVGL